MSTSKQWPALLGLLAVLAAPGSLFPDATEVVAPGGGERVDAFFTRFEAFGFHGVVLVATGDSVVLRKGYGFADRARGLRNAPETAFGIASLDKQFTGAAILVLEQEGKLKTTDPISNYLDHVPDDKKAITIAHLLNHRSGLPNTYRDAYTDLLFDEFVGEILRTELAAPIGSRRMYSNSGYNLLEFIIEQVSGQDYESFLAEHLFQPAGMHTTGHHLVKFDEDKMARYSVPQSQLKLLQREPKRPDAFLSFRTTVDDFYRWHLALQGDHVLSPEVKAKLFQPAVDNYANGWYVGRTVRDTPVQYHGGYGTATDLFAMMYRYPAEDAVVIVFANTTMNRTLNRTHLSVIVERLIFGGTVMMPPPPATIPDAEVQAFEGTYRFDAGGLFEIRRDEAGLTLEASDKQAVLALQYPDAASENDAYVLDTQLSAVFFGFERGDFGPLQAVTKEASFEGVEERWRKRWELYRRFHGSLQSVRVLHRLETEYGGAPEIQTHLLLAFEKGTRLVRALADAEGHYLFDLISLPQQLEMRLVPLSETELAGWDLRLQMGPTLALGDPEGNTLKVHGKAGWVTATRDSHN